jgi:hypothetical protein
MLRIATVEMTVGFSTERLDNPPDRACSFLRIYRNFFEIFFKSDEPLNWRQRITRKLISHPPPLEKFS